MSEWPPSTRPFRSNPPEGAVGIVLPIQDNLRFFKLAYHSILGFTDYRFMLTIVDNMSGIQTRQYLESIRRNHNINVLQYQKDHDLKSEWDLGLKFMFSFSSVKYGLVLTPNMVVEPFWLSGMVRALDHMADVDAVVPDSNVDNPQAMLFRREAYERLEAEAADRKDFFVGFKCRNLSMVYVHKFKVNGYDPRPEPAKEEASNARA